MKYTETKIKDVWVIEPEVFGDERGYFMETWRADEFEREVGERIAWVQDNESKSSRGVLRGLHFQRGETAQAKLVRVIEGAVLDVAVDIRKGSETFGQYVAVELTSENKKQLYVPRGMAHGFLVLSETATFVYKCDNFYAPEEAGEIRYDDPEIGIEWPDLGAEFNLSEKDVTAPLLKDAQLG